MALTYIEIGIKFTVCLLKMKIFTIFFMRISYLVKCQQISTILLRRRVRGDRLLEKFVVEAGVELQTTPTTTTTTTLSPEQIEEQKRVS